MTMPPFKHTSSMKEIRWSKWVESMRKDVECAFGILKGRWRILKTGIRMQGESADMIWLTCCALHNMLLESDGLDDAWSSDWTADSELNSSHEEDREAMPISMRRLYDREMLSRNYDATEIAAQMAAVASQQEREEAGGEARPLWAQPSRPDEMDTDTGAASARVVRDLSCDYFRSCLVEHFDILFHHGGSVGRHIKWPAYKKADTGMQI